MTRKLYGKRRLRDQNYATKALAILATQKPGSVVIVDVVHDDSCSFWKDGNCDCEPDVRERKLQ